LRSAVWLKSERPYLPNTLFEPGVLTDCGATGVGTRAGS